MPKLSQTVLNSCAPQFKLRSMSPRVLVVGPGANTRGGIASVLRVHMEMPVWREMQCKLLSTYDDTNARSKLRAAVWAYVRAPFEVIKADIVHLHLAGQFSLMRKLPIAIISFLLAKRVIVHVHASSPESLFHSTPGWAVRFVLGRADCLVALSTSWANLLRDHIPGASIRVVPNPVRSASLENGRLARKPAILFVGKLEQRKGYMTLLQAAPSILRQHPDVQFWFAGHGELDRARAEADRLGIASSVRLLGWQNSSEIEKLYQEARIFCLPSHNEGVPMSVLEAMSHGTPVVCTRVGGLSEVIADGENGLFAAVGNPKSIAEKILCLLNDNAYASAIGMAGLHSVQRTCGFEIVGDHLRKLYLSFAPKPDGISLRGREVD